MSGSTGRHENLVGEDFDKINLAAGGAKSAQRTLAGEGK
jgi:hypothetical protein